MSYVHFGQLYVHKYIYFLRDYLFYNIRSCVGLYTLSLGDKHNLQNVWHQLRLLAMGSHEY